MLTARRTPGSCIRNRLSFGPTARLALPDILWTTKNVDAGIHGSFPVHLPMVQDTIVSCRVFSATPSRESAS